MLFTSFIIPSTTLAGSAPRQVHSIGIVSPSDNRDSTAYLCHLEGRRVLTENIFNLQENFAVKST